MEKIEINDTENIPVEIIDTRREIDNLSDAELKELEKKLEQYDKDSWQYAEYLEKFKHITLFFSAPESMSKRLRNCIRGKIPKVDAVRDVLSGIDPEEVRKIHEETVDTLKKNRIFREGTIGGYVVAGIDGADALYLNAAFINTVKENGLEAVIRLKDEKRLIFQDAGGLFDRGEGKKRSFKRGKKTVEVWDLSGFRIENCPHRLRVVRYHESWKENGKKAERWMWLVTTLEQTAPGILWEMMNRRWDIEENGFHQLKTYYHAKHCYCHAAVEVIFNLMIIGFNMRDRRSQRFEGSGITRKSVSRIFRDDLLTEKVKKILYQKGG